MKDKEELKLELDEAKVEVDEAKAHGRNPGQHKKKLLKGFSGRLFGNKKKLGLSLSFNYYRREMENFRNLYCL